MLPGVPSTTPTLAGRSNAVVGKTVAGPDTSFPEQETCRREPADVPPAPDIVGGNHEKSVDLSTPSPAANLHVGNVGNIE